MNWKPLLSVAAAIVTLTTTAGAATPLTISSNKTNLEPGTVFNIQIQGCPGDLVLLMASPTLNGSTLPKIGNLTIGQPTMYMVFGPIGATGIIDAPCDLPCVQTIPNVFTANYQAVSADPSIVYIPITGKSNVISLTYDPTVYRDCNGNRIHDDCDIRDGFSLDINLDGVPDECVDCDGNGEADGPNVSGHVWHDLNCNGIEDPNDPGVPDVFVTAFDLNDMIVGGTSTNADGDYTLTNVSQLGGIRLEFSDFPSYLVVAPAAKGTGKETQFILGQTCDADLALVAPAELCPEGANACLATPCYINGDPLAGGDAANLDVLVRYPYNATGTGSNTYLAVGKDLGATWGLAYQRGTDTLFAASFLKRHVGFGPGGVGAIYAVDDACFGAPNPANVSVWLDVNTLPGVSVGSVMRPDLSPMTTGASFDSDAYFKVGKVGLGGLAISEDDRTLYAVNLSSREVLEIDVDSKTLLNRYPTSNGITCVNGEARPFAVSYFRGQLYTGVVCTAENGGNKQNLMAHIRRLDNGVFTDVLTFPLNYQRASTYEACPGVAGWFQWVPMLFPPACGIGSVVFPQPMLSSIEFDNDGSMAIGFIDRFGHQTGVSNFSLTGASLFEGFSGGELLRAQLEDGVWLLENNGKSGNVTTVGAGNNQGPGGGEYFHDESWKVNGQIAHNETALGGIAILPGSDEVASNVFDPINGTQVEIRTGGSRRFSSITGNTTASYKVYDINQAGTFGKAAGLGDLALLCSALAVEVGDRVFLDVNKNGIQDPTEAGIGGVTLLLYRGGQQVDMTTTATDGTFSFTDIVSNDATYEIRVSTTQSALSGLVPSPFHAVPNPLADSDGDPSLVAGFVTATLGAKGPGRNDFSVDFGFHTP